MQLLAVNFPTVIAIIFFCLVIIGWLANMVGRPQQQQQRDRERRRQPPRRTPRSSEFVPEDEVEVVRTPARPARPGRPATQQAPRRPGTPRPERVPVSQPQARSQPASRRNEPALATSPGMGQELRQHLSSAMAARVSAQVSQDLPHAVDRSVSDHLGKFSGTQEAAAPTFEESRLTNLVAQLRNPDGVRGAFIVNELLSPPLALRKRS